MQLLPAPGNVLPKGSIKFNLGSKPSTMTLMLQVTNSTGQQVTRSVIIETYDPNPSYPAATVAKAAAEAFANAQIWVFLIAVSYFMLIDTWYD